MVVAVVIVALVVLSKSQFRYSIGRVFYTPVLVEVDAEIIPH